MCAKEEFKDIKGVIRIRKLTDRDHNGQRKSTKVHRNLTIDQHELLKTGGQIRRDSS